MPPADSLPTAIATLFAVWLFALGGVIGSFLNVVVYRLPRRMSLIEPPSHCPHCRHLIRWYDNVPILAWILLRGRCRDCHTPIPVRYPAVEAVTATLFLALAAVECLSGGVNLPPRTVVLPDAVITLSRTPAELYGIYAYHLWLLCTLLAAALIELDGNHPPLRLYLPALAVGLAAPLLWPALHPASRELPLGWFRAGFDGAAGLVAGALLGRTAAFLRPRQDALAATWGAACVGLFLGWQAAVLVTIIAAAIGLPSVLLSRRFPAATRVFPSLCLLLVALAWILLWRHILYLI